jgi:diaminopimelate epimerase
MGRARGGRLGHRAVTLDVPGGRLTVTVDGRRTVLSGPAVVVAAGELTREWLAGR